MKHQKLAGCRMSPLHTFLRYCENSKLEKKILDCGAGGEEPPLFLFHQLGYRTYGVEISDEQLEKARVFCKKRGIDLGIRKGDMRNLPFEDRSFSFVYSYDAVFHMPKREVSIAMEEMKRVLKKEGLLFVNFVSTKHIAFGRGREVGAGEFMQNGRCGKVLLSYYEEDEPDQYFNGFEVLCKVERIMKFTHNGAHDLGSDVEVKQHVYASLDYIAKKR